MIGSRHARLPRLSSIGALVSVLALAVAACGGAGGEAAKGAAPPRATEVPEREPTSIEEAEKDIARAKAQLAALGGPASGPGVSPGSVTADAARPAPPPEPAPSPRTESAPTHPMQPEAPKASLGFEDRCASPCRAIASMRRAVTALCRMTGDEDTRCTDAKRTLTDSEKRLSACTC